MSRIPITLTDDFKEVVSDYQKANKLKSWTQALLHLAALGYEQETGQAAPESYAGWGGWRGKKESLDALIVYADKYSNGGQDDPAEAD